MFLKNSIDPLVKTHGLGYNIVLALLNCQQRQKISKNIRESYPFNQI
jgi:hypothetical protein